MSISIPANIRLLILDDHVLFRESLARLLHSEPGFQVVEHCGTTSEALRAVKAHAIDLILLDLDLGSERGSDALQELRGGGYEGKVLLVTAGVAAGDVPNLIRQGIAGVFMKHSSPALLVEGIRETMRGKVWFDQELLQQALSTTSPAAIDPRPPGLTKREKQVLSLVFQGLTNKEIASRVDVSESSVKACLQNLFTKTGVRTRSQLVRVALEQYKDDS